MDTMDRDRGRLNWAVAVRRPYGRRGRWSRPTNLIPEAKGPPAPDFSTTRLTTISAIISSALRTACCHI